MRERRYKFFKLTEEITIHKIYSFHYIELTKDYVYKGEKHDFWELVYVDKGEVEIVIEGNSRIFKQGDMVFYAPNVFHSLKCNHRTPPNLFIVSFECKSEAMQYFANQSLRLGNEESQLLSIMIEEGSRVFTTPPRKRHRKNQPLQSIEKVANPYFGSEQLLKIYLEALLIRFYRNGMEHLPVPKRLTITKETEEKGLSAKLERYIEEHMAEPLTLKQICNDFALSKTHITSVFRKYNDCGIMEHWARLRIEKAKLLIREETCNVTEISERLGYTSVHYFSRQFKKITGMSPTAYLRRLKAIL
ncbi:MAG: AraC family transcriptional regulator [Paenibacillus sp.]|jgi:AraC-like DNA-binding protein/mannose-6-phosphate isomerase-like protein (cupin superfamily)|nr:AraC family transcriptional regulator [Paenibacillus sp.]